MSEDEEGEEVMTWADEEMERMERIAERIIAAAAKVAPEYRRAEVISAASPMRLTFDQVTKFVAAATERAKEGGRR